MLTAMRHGPDVARVAALFGDPARAEMLTALMDGRSLTAGELARVAGVAPSTASAHLARLAGGGLVIVEPRGRRRHVRLADASVAAALEAVMAAAAAVGPRRTRLGPREPALRHARVCYDHLAGELGVLLFDRLLAAGDLLAHGSTLTLTPLGKARLARIDIDISALSRRRSAVRACLDWSERRPHLAGAVGAAMLRRMLELGWLVRTEGRMLRIDAVGRSALDRWSLA